MLNRMVVVFLVVAVALVSAAPMASADGGVVCVSRNTFGVCVLEVPVPRGGGGGGGAGGERECLWQGAPISCWHGEYGTWLSPPNGYCKVAEVQPPVDDPVWNGNLTGSIYACQLKSGTSFGRTLMVWLPSASAPDPVVLARAAVARMGLRAIDLGIAPKTLAQVSGSVGLVGLPVWMWVEGRGPEVTGPQTVTVAESVWSVTATARLSKVVWDMGDGHRVVCGLGDRYELWRGKSASPSCGYRYDKPGIYTVTATSMWEVSWSGLGQSGVIPMELSTSGEVRIVEIHVVATNP